MRLLRFAMLVSPFLTPVFAQNANERIYQSIRNNDLATLQTLIKQNAANTADSRGQTPLMIAAAFGSYRRIAESRCY